MANKGKGVDMIEKLDRDKFIRQWHMAESEEVVVAKINEIIDHLNANVVQCSCPPWYQDYVKNAHDLNKDSLYIRGCGWTCPLHGQIST